MAGSCGAFCSFCGRCGRRIADELCDMKPKDVPPPGVSDKSVGRRGAQEKTLEPNETQPTSRA